MLHKALHFRPAISCPLCRYHGPAAKLISGSFAIEVVLWLCGILPGLLYTLWRKSSEGYGCPCCGNEHVIKSDAAA